MSYGAAAGGPPSTGGHGAAGAVSAAPAPAPSGGSRVMPITSQREEDSSLYSSQMTALLSSPSTSKASQVAPVQPVWETGNTASTALKRSPQPAQRAERQGHDSDSDDHLSEVGDTVEEIRLPSSSASTNPSTIHAGSGRKTPSRSVLAIDQGEVSKLVSVKKSFANRVLTIISDSWHHGYLKAVILWVVWLVSGTVFYAIRNELGWGQGFYMMINVGYSIGWGYPIEIDRHCMWFSAMNVLVGATALSFALKLFAEGLLEKAKDWYAIALYESKMADRDIPWYIKTREWCWAKREELFIIAFFVLWVCLMVVWSTQTYTDWMIVQGIYFAVSSLSTGGMYPIPMGTADFNYVIVAAFTAIGVPLMCLAMGNVVSLVVPLGDAEEAKKLINARVTEEELRMMRQFGVCAGDGSRIERAEFMLLCAVRLGTVDIGLIEEIKRRYAVLDVDGDGTLSISEILQEARALQLPPMSGRFSISGSRSHSSGKHRDSVEIRTLRGEIERMHRERFSAWGIFRHYFKEFYKNGYIRAFLFWSIWMITGTTFYAIRNELGWALGFYMMINVGYSVSWGYPTEIDNECRWFSTINVLFGTVALSYGLHVFSTGIVNQSKQWYSIALYQLKMNRESSSRFDRYINWCLYNTKPLFTIAFALLWILSMTWWSIFTFKDWKFVNGLYFAVGALSTGGMFPIPRDATHAQYVIAGLFTAVGVPLMCLMVMNTTTLALSIGDPEKAKKLIRSRVSLEELELMSKLGVRSAENEIDFAEFVLLCCVRLGALNPGLIEEINNRFEKLDISKKGYLTRDEILQDFRRGNLYSRWTKAELMPQNSILATAAMASKT